MLVGWASVSDDFAAMASSGVSSGQIALEITTNAGAGGGGAKAGPRRGAHEASGTGLSEWANRMMDAGCVMVSTLFMIGAAGALAGLALAVVYNMDPSTDCLSSFAGISFSYVSWLKWMGITFFIGLFVELVLVFVHGVAGTMLSEKLAIWFGWLFFIFQTAWCAVGSILYWKTVTNNCQFGSDIQAIGLTEFVVQCFIATCLVCGRGVSRAARRAT